MLMHGSEQVAATGVSCANCGADVPGKFCGQCGQSTRGLDSTVDVVKETLQEVFSYEGRTLRTLRLLFQQPGRVTAEYLAGRRQSYTAPVRSFLAATALFFFGFLFTRPVAARYYGYERRDLSGYVDAMTTILVLMLPVTALALALLYVRKRRPLVQHVIFTLYGGTVALLWMFTVMMIAAAMRASWGHYSAAPAWLPEFALWLYLPAVVLYFGHLAMALRTVYRSGWTGSILRAMAMALIMVALFFVAVPRLLAILG